MEELSKGQKAAITNKKRYGDDFYVTIGRKGGMKTTAEGAAPKGFAANRALASLAGKKSKRGPANGKQNRSSTS